MTLWRSIAVLAILMHAVGQTLFLIPLAKFAGTWGQSTHSWLLGDSAATRGLGILLYTAALALFVIAALAVFRLEDWQTTAIWAAILSQIGLILFWVQPMPTGVLPATLFNIAVVVAGLLLQ
jgi:hypothetical protein